jgi:hypothetical protein
LAWPSMRVTGSMTMRRVMAERKEAAGAGVSRI